MQLVKIHTIEMDRDINVLQKMREANPRPVKTTRQDETDKLSILLGTGLTIILCTCTCIHFCDISSYVQSTIPLTHGLPCT